MEKEVPPDALLSKLDRSLDRDQDRALFGLPPKLPRRRRSHSAGGVCAPRGLATGLVSPMAPGEASTRVPVSRPCPRTSSASPSPSGPEAANLGTPALPRSSSGPPITSWFAPENSTTRIVR